MRSELIGLTAEYECFTHRSRTLKHLLLAEKFILPLTIDIATFDHCKSSNSLCRFMYVHQIRLMASNTGGCPETDPAQVSCITCNLTMLRHSCLRSDTGFGCFQLCKQWPDSLLPLLRECCLPLATLVCRVHWNLRIGRIYVNSLSACQLVLVISDLSL